MLDMKRSGAVAALLAGACATAGANVVLWDNGSMVTHPGAGAGGADVSMASLVPNTAGSNVTGNVQRADDFTVGAEGWLVSTIQMFGYDTNFATPRFESATITIRSGTPDGAVVASESATWELAGINRTFNGVGNLGNTARQIQRVTADFGDLELAPGVYWVALSIVNTTGGNNWMSFVMDPNPADPNDPITRVGNAYVSTNGGVDWNPFVVGTGDWNQSPELPFIVSGSIIPAPGAMALLGMGGLIAGRRRRA